MTTLKDLTTEEIAFIKGRINRGDKYQDIAADYRLNQGRISDLKFGRLYPEIEATDLTKKINLPHKASNDKTQNKSKKA